MIVNNIILKNMMLNLSPVPFPNRNLGPKWYCINSRATDFLDLNKVQLKWQKLHSFIESRLYYQVLLDMRCIPYSGSKMRQYTDKVIPQVQLSWCLCWWAKCDVHLCQTQRKVSSCCIMEKWKCSVNLFFTKGLNWLEPCIQHHYYKHE